MDATPPAPAPTPIQTPAPRPRRITAREWLRRQLRAGRTLSGLATAAGIGLTTLHRYVQFGEAAMKVPQLKKLHRAARRGFSLCKTLGIEPD